MRLLVLLSLLLAGLGLPARRARAETVSVYDIIAEVNKIRTGNGLPALQINSILMSTAQSTAEIMAANRSCSHLGEVSERVAAAGYGGGARVWATENISCGPKTVQQIVYNDWADELHMLPMTNASYTDVGAGASEVEGFAYYVLHAAYTTGPSGQVNTPAATSFPALPSRTAEVIMPVQTATAIENGAIYHIVQPGQTLTMIANAYGVTLANLLALNGISPDTPVIYAGQKLLIQPAPTATISPTPTNTSPPPTRTPKSSPTPRPPKPTRTATPAPTATVRSLLPDVPILESRNHRSFGIGMIVLCAIGLVIVALSWIRKR